jgi:alcohol dehydrogenase class IV
MENREISFDHLRGLNIEGTIVWTINRFKERISEILPYDVVDSNSPVSANIRRLIVVGGGTLIDKAKYARASAGHPFELIAVPTIWGSGAERSRIAVGTGAVGKVYSISDTYLPDMYCYCDELARLVQGERAVYACGDVWAHALEALLSPLADEGIRSGASSLIQKMFDLPLEYHPAWLGLSGQACWLQSNSSVGLVHAIAHVLEPLLVASSDGFSWYHAKLCSVLLFPVMEFNRLRSNVVDRKLSAVNLRTEDVMKVCKQLSDRVAFEALRPAICSNWSAIARDVSARTNCTVVSRQSLDFFVQW